VRIFALAAALALLTAAPAAASSWPPPSPQPGIAVVTIAPAHVNAVATHSCMAREQRLKIARWLAPVACEQPPRSQLLLASLFGD
jgi:hypothetical protein